MKEKCAQLAQKLYFIVLQQGYSQASSEVMMAEKIENFAREIRQEAFEEAARVIERVSSQPVLGGHINASLEELRALKYK